MKKYILLTVMLLSMTLQLVTDTEVILKPNGDVVICKPGPRGIQVCI